MLLSPPWVFSEHSLQRTSLTKFSQNNERAQTSPGYCWCIRRRPSGEGRPVHSNSVNEILTEIQWIVYSCRWTDGSEGKLQEVYFDRNRVDSILDWKLRKKGECRRTGTYLPFSIHFWDSMWSPRLRQAIWSTNLIRFKLKIYRKKRTFNLKVSKKVKAFNSKVWALRKLFQNQSSDSEIQVRNSDAKFSSRFGRLETRRKGRALLINC